LIEVSAMHLLTCSQGQRGPRNSVWALSFMAHDLTNTLHLTPDALESFAAVSLTRRVPCERGGFVVFGMYAHNSYTQHVKPTLGL
jgi:hypothetical protein